MNLLQQHNNFCHHTSYSLDITPSDFYLFSYQQTHFAGATFKSARDVKNEIVYSLQVSRLKVLENYKKTGRK